MRTSTAARWTLAAALGCILLPGPAPAQETLRVGIIPIEDALPFLVLEKEKLVPGLRVITYQSGSERDAAIRSGEIDGCVTDPLGTALLRCGGLDLSIAWVVSGSHPQVSRLSILASPKSDILSLPQLKGVPVALARNTIAEFVTDTLLTDAGFAPGEIVKEEVTSITSRYLALMEGKVSAAALPDSVAFLAESQGARRLISDTHGGKSRYQRVLVFTRKAIGVKRPIIRALLEGYDPLIVRLNSGRDKYRPLMLKLGGIPDPVLDDYVMGRLGTAQIPDRDAIQPLLSWAKGKGLLPRPVTYEELVDGSFLR